MVFRGHKNYYLCFLLCISIFTFLFFPLLKSTVCYAQEFTATAIGQFGDITVMEVTGNYDADNPDGSFNSIPRQEIAQEFYRNHADDYDFLVIFSNFDFAMPAIEVLAFFHPVKNDISGIGVKSEDGNEFFNHTELFGSSGMLQGTIDMGNIETIVADPLAPGFDFTMLTLSHEILHRWAAYVAFQKEGDSSVSTALLGKGGAHWSFLLDTAGSLMYGNRWQDNGDGTFTSLPGHKYYSPLDLYLMGLIDASEVPPMLLITDPDPPIDPARTPEAGITIKGTPEYITIEDIIRAEGERIPGVGDSQKRFSLGCILVTRPGTFTGDELYLIRTIIKNWVMWFSCLTDGRAMVRFDAAPLEDIPENPGITPPPLVPIQDPDINAGVDWLIEHQLEDGSWMDVSQTAERDTVEAVHALSNFPYAGDNVADGLAWLEGISSHNTDYLARRIEVVVDAGQGAGPLIEEILSRRNPDGGWGSNRRYMSNPIDTSFALRALAHAGYPDDHVTEAAIEYLKAAQNEDGGWGDEGPGTIQATTNVLSAFKIYQDANSLDDRIQSGIAWLKQRQNPDSGFGNSPSTVYDTAMALLLLKDFNTEFEVTDGALGYLQEQQSENGSWYESPYQTALAVSAMYTAAVDPDLYVSTADILLTPSTVTTLPAEVDVNVRILNLGRTGVTDVRVALFDGGISIDREVDSRTISMEGNSSTTLSLRVTVTDGNIHRLYVVIDPEGSVREATTSNNTAMKALYPAATYDFAVTDVSLSPEETDIFHTVTITAQVTNRGTRDAYGKNAVPLLYAVNGMEIATVNVDIPAGSSIIRDIPWRASIAGDLSVSVQADPNNDIPEVSEENNTRSASLLVHPSSLPNVTISHEDMVLTPIPALESQPVTIEALVKNVGFAPADDVQVAFYRGVPGEGGVLLGTRTIESLGTDPDSNVAQVVFEWTPLSVSGQQVIFIQVDPNDVIQEGSEEDNSAFRALEILSLPDLVLSQGAIAFSPPAPKEGDPNFEIRVTVWNSGDQPAQDVSVALHDGDALVGTATIPTLTGNTQETVAFAYDLTGISGVREIRAVADPNNMILEQSEGNNSASRSLGVQDADLWVTEPYISPNGDGIKDSTRLFFRLDMPRTVTILVLDDTDGGVRTYGGPGFEGIAEGTVTWDGLDDRGRVVADGEYRLQVRDENGDTLGGIAVVVDNNRSPLTDAIGTKYLQHANLSCMLPDIDQWEWFPDESGIVFFISQYNRISPEYPNGIYTMAPDGSDIARLVPWEWSYDYHPVYRYTYGTGWPNGFSLSPDGGKVAFVVKIYNADIGKTEKSELWVVDRYGENLTLLDSRNLTQQGAKSINAMYWSPDSSAIAYVCYHYSSGSDLHIIRPDGTGGILIEPANMSGLDTKTIRWSPDNQHLAYVTSSSSGFDVTSTIHLSDPLGNTTTLPQPIPEGPYRLEWLNTSTIIFITEGPYTGLREGWLLDIAGAGEPIQITEDMYFKVEMAVNPDGRRFAFLENNGSELAVKVCNDAGQCEILHEAAIYPNVTSLSDLTWSPDGGTLTFVDHVYEVESLCICDGYLFAVNMATQETAAFKVSEDADVCEMEESYHILVQEEGAWADHATLHYEFEYATRRLDLTGAFKDPTAPYRLRITQRGMDAAHIDYLALSIDGILHTPIQAINLTNGEDILQKLISPEHDVADVHEATIEIVWENVPGAHGILLVMNAREEDLSKRKAVPFRYPEDGYYSVELVEGTSIVVDGQITPKDGLTESLFAVYSMPVTGHPRGYTYGYVSCDKSHLYGVLDFTPDNTQDNGRDWASMEVVTPAGTYSFMINDAQQEYGTSCLTYTDKVVYAHKVYEFRIPLGEIGARTGDRIRVSFSAYGTSGADGGPGGLHFTEGSLRWLPDNITLMGLDENDALFFLDTENGERSTIPVEVLWETDPRVSPLGRYITYTQPTDPESPCADRGYYDLWSLSSLLNLTADLRITRDMSAITVRGTAADLNFAEYLLEYAKIDEPNEWEPICPASDVPVINDTFISWVPPEEGTYLVRLTVSDKAGNSVWTRRQVSWGIASSIVSLYKTNELFSPKNLDNIKDTANLHYRVVKPVHLAFYVYDKDGRLVRTFLREHPLTGPYEINWDGKDEQGGFVTDGVYTMRVFDYEFFFTVDNIPPDGELKVIPDDLIQESGNPCSPSTALWGWVDDPHLKSWTIGYGEGDTPAKWSEQMSGAGPFGHPQDMEQIKLFENMLIESLVNGRYRMTAEDRAGNRSTFLTDFLKEVMLLNQWEIPEALRTSGDRWQCIPLTREIDGTIVSDGTVPQLYAQPGPHAIAGIETVRLPLDSMELQYRTAPNGIWIPAQTIMYPDSGPINLTWDTSDPLIERIDAVRIYAEDELGNEYTSNVLSIGSVLSIHTHCDPLDDYAEQLLTEGLRRLAFQIYSEQDERYPVWTDYHVYTTDIPVGRIDPLPLPPDLREGMTYKLQMAATTMSGRQYRSMPAEYPRICPMLQLNITFDEAIDCNSLSTGTATISSSVIVREQEKLFLKTLSYFIDDAGESRLLGQFDLSEVDLSDATVTMDTSAMAEGNYRVTAVLEFMADYTLQRIDDMEDLVVDRMMPQAAITFPGPSHQVCRDRFQDSKGEWYGILIEGRATDDDGQVARYKLFYGFGEGPVQWIEAKTRTNGRAIAIEGNEAVQGEIGTWDVTDIQGTEFSFMLQVVDHAGNITCTSTSFSIDTRIDMFLAADTKMISPENGDGILDAVQIAYTIEEPADVDAEVVSGDTTVRTLASGVPHFGGTGTIAWNGRDEGGQPVLDGIYDIVVRAIDSCGNSSQKGVAVEVDNTPPVTLITAPLPGEINAAMVEISGTAHDLHFSSYRLYAENGTDSLVIGQGATPVVEGTLGTWNTSGLEDTWTIRLAAIDRAGNSAETYISVILGERGDLIEHLDAAPRLFSPNGDGRRDSAQILFELNEPCGVDIEIRNAGDQLVHAHAIASLAQGAHTYEWDGTDSGGETVQDGTYTVSLIARTADPNDTQTEGISLSVDIIPPEIDLELPAEDAYLKGILTVRGSITDLNLSHYSISCEGEGGTRLLDEANQVREQYTFASVSDLPEGSYTLRAEAEDQGETITPPVSIPFTIDRTPPNLAMLAPAQDEAYGSERNVVPVKVRIEEAHLASFDLRYGLGDNPDQWLPLAAGTTLPEGNELNISWDVGPNAPVPVPDGRYTLSLRASDKAGWEREVRVRIVIDNTPPVVSLTQPEEGGYVTGAVDIRGTAADMNLKEYIVEASQGDCGSAFKWAPIAISGNTVENGVLAAWKGLPPDGLYCLRVTATDAVGNSVESHVNVIVDTHPPAAPVLSGTVESASEVRLSWTQNTEPDLAGYHIYKNNQRLNDEPIAATRYTDLDLGEGEYTYTVRAVDKAGWESGLSNEVTLEVDVTPPAAKISSPRHNSAVSCLVEIKGTAFSTDDFKEYRVYVGQGANPADWTLIRRSPIPTPYDILARWDTLGLQETTYAIRLEAEDLAGNVGIHQVAVIIDNTPPDPPTGLSAEAYDSDVIIFWGENSEPDLAGYLLYRNHELVNAPGTVTGSLFPYLLTDPFYFEMGLPDGTFTYFLVAMDMAGNLSEASDAIAVTIDTHPPAAEIVSPPFGHRFDTMLMIRAESPDLDIAQVQFQYKDVTGDFWIDLGDPVTTRPYVAYLDTNDLVFDSYYLLRAKATDQGGRTDPWPMEVMVHYMDVTPPAPPQDVEAAVDGEEVTLSWTPNTEEDLDGYNVYAVLGDSTDLLNGSPIQGPSFVDSGLPDGEYRYQVTAVDIYGNESAPSGVTLARVFTPLLVQPYTPTAVPAVRIEGSNAGAYAHVEILIETDTNATIHGPITADAEGNFFLDANLALGENWIFAAATNTEGNKSRPSEPVLVVYNEPPAKPTGLLATVDGHEVTLTWNPNSEPDLAGYDLYRDGNRVNSTLPVTSGSVSAENDDQGDCYHSGYFDPETDTFCIFSDYSRTYCPAGFTITLDYQEPPLVRGIEVAWFESSYYNELYAAKDFEVQVWTGASWLTLAKVFGNGEESNAVVFTPSYRTDRIRILVTDVIDPYFMAGEVSVAVEDLITGESYVDTGVPDGRRRYRLTAVDWYGFESEPSEEAEALVGDTNSPVPPQGLTASVSGAGILLTWDQNNQEDDLAGYHVYRGTTPGGPYARVNDAVVTPTEYLDSGPSFGVTYYYVVVAVDNAGNESDHSNEASVTMVDILPPAAPIFLSPTTSGTPLNVNTQRVAIAGWAEPSSTVDLTRNGVPAGTTTASSSSTLSRSFTLNMNGYYENAALSPDGRLLAYTRYDDTGEESFGIEKLETGERTTITPSGMLPKWSPDGQRLAFTVSIREPDFYLDKILVYDIGSNTGMPLTDDPYSGEYSPTWSSDGMKLAFVSDSEGPDDVWVKDFDTGSLTRVTFYTDAIYAALSPDGSKVAYVGDDGLFVTDIEKGDSIMVDTSQDQGDPWAFRYSPPEWSPDSRSLAFVSYRNGNPDLFVADTENWNTAQLTDNEGLEWMPRWSPDGTHIVFGASDGDIDEIRIARADAQDGGMLLERMDFLALSHLSWLPDGRIAVIAGYSLRLLYPPGYFRFEGIDLDAGENLFHAFAIDAAGNVSPESDGIILILDTTLFPDLEVLTEDIFIYPSMPVAGEEVMVSVFVWNQGSAEVQDVDVGIFVWDAFGTLEPVLSATIPSLAPYFAFPLSFSWDTTGKAGENSVIAVIDPANRIAEASEENNYATRSFFVVEDEGVELSAAVDAASYGSNEDVDIRIQLQNSGPERAGTLKVHIEDEGGATVTMAGAMDVQLPYGAQQEYRFVWNTGMTYAGGYRVRAVLREAGVAVAEAMLPFAIIPDIDVDAALVTDRTHYGPNSTVYLTLRIENNGFNHDIPGLNVLIRILDHQDTILFTEERACSGLLAGSFVRLNTSWNTGLSAPGEYHADAEVVLNGAALSAGSASFAIDPLVTLAGSIAVQPPVVILGNVVTAPYTITTSGNTPAGEVLLSGVVMDAQTRQIVGIAEDVLILGMNETQSGQFLFPTAGYGLAHYQIALYAEREGVTKTIGTANFSLVDGTPPILTIISPLPGSILDGAFDLTTLATDNASGIKTVEYQVDGGAWLPLPASDPSAGRYTTRWEPAEEDQGTHTITFRATDRAGNMSLPISTTILIELLSPFERLSGDLTASPDPVNMGEEETLAYVITNAVSKGISGLTIMVPITDAATGAPVTTLQHIIDVPMNSTVQGDFTLSTADILPGEYNAELLVSVATEPEPRTLATTGFTVRDGTPPIVTIVSPISGSVIEEAFNLTVEATDNISGISSVEYQVDGGTWLPLPVSDPSAGLYSTLWEPTEEDEGDHTIGFRATDGAGNVSITVSTYITIMLISPFEQLFGDLTAAPDPVYMGEEEILTYTLTNEVRKEIHGLVVRVLVKDAATDANVTTLERTIDVPMEATIQGSFTLDTSGMLPGTYDAELLVALDTEAEQRSLAVTSFEVQSSLDATKVIADPINLLVWVNDKCHRKEEPDKDRIRMRAADTEEPAAVDDEEEYYLMFLDETGLEPPEEWPAEDVPASDVNASEETDDADETKIRYCHGSWNQCIRVDLLEQILAEAATSYRIVYNRKDFEKEMRNPFYTDILILGDHQPLGYTEALELRERVNAGIGLVSSLWLKHFTIFSSQCWKKANVFGVYWKGSLGRGTYTVTTVEGPITEEGSFTAQGDAEKVEAVEDASVAGWMIKGNPGHKKNKEYPAIVLSEYGLGRTVYCAFDLGLSLSEETYDRMAQLITNAVSYVHRSEEGTVFMPFRFAPLRLEFTSLFGGLDVRASETFPAELTLFDPAAGAWIEESPWTITLHLEPGETHAVSYYAFTPDRAGTYTLETEAGLMQDDAFIVLAELTTDIQVTTNAATLIDDIIETLRSLSPDHKDKAKVRIVIRLLEGVRKRGNDKKRDIERNIRDILISIDTLLMTKEVDTDPVRVMLDDLLRIEQGMYYLSP